MKRFKREWALLISAVMTVSLAACGGSGSGKTAETTAANTTASTTAAPAADAGGSTQAAAAEAETTAAPEIDYPDYVTEPITIQLWHSSGTGVNMDYIDTAIEEFNSTNEYGITVVGTYQGGYDANLSKITTAVAAGEAPELVVLSSPGLSYLTSNGVFADLSPYVARDGVDMDNFVPGMKNFVIRGDQINSFQFNLSTGVLVYNKAIYDEMGFEAPTSFEELREQAKAIHEAHPDVYGFTQTFDTMFTQGQIRSLGGENLISDDGNSPGALDNGAVLKLLTDWKEGIDEGWEFAVPVTGAGQTNQDMLVNGDLATLFVSSRALGDLLRYANENGTEIGVSLPVVYGGYGSDTGGGNMAVISRDKTDQQIAAAWEFIKFVSSDEQVAKRVVMTGYLPISYSSTETEEIQTLWKEHPEYKVAFDELQYAGDYPFTLYQSEYMNYYVQAFSYVIQDGSMSPEEAVEYMREQAKIVFPGYSG